MPKTYSEADFADSTAAPVAAPSAPAVFDDSDFADAAVTPVLPPKPPAATSNWARRNVADPAIALAKGVVGLPKMAAGLVDAATAATAMNPIINPVGTYNLIRGKPVTGHAGALLDRAVKFLGGGFKETNAYLDSLLSPEQKEDDRAVADAVGFLATVKQSILHPSTIVQAGVESAPGMMAGAGMSKVALGTVTRAIVTQFPKLSPAVAAALAESVAAGAGEGAVTIGQNLEQVRSETPGGLLTGKQTGAVAASGFITGLVSSMGGGLARRLGIEDIDVLLANGPRGSKSLGVVSRVILGAIQEGAFEELPQSLQEQVAQNYALGRPLHEGVLEAGAQGMLVGAAMGGGSNLLGGKPDAPDGADNGVDASPLIAWAAANQDAARKIAGIETPSRKDFEAAGLPRTTAETRARIAADLRDIVAASSEPGADPESKTPLTDQAFRKAARDQAARDLAGDQPPAAPPVKTQTVSEKGVKTVETPAAQQPAQQPAQEAPAPAPVVAPVEPEKAKEPAKAPDYAATAKELGIRFDGVQPNSPEPIQFTDTQKGSPAYGATFNLPEGATAEDLAAKLAEKRAQFAEGAAKEEQRRAAATEKAMGIAKHMKRGLSRDAAEAAWEGEQGQLKTNAEGVRPNIADLPQPDPEPAEAPPVETPAPKAADVASVSDSDIESLVNGAFDAPAATTAAPKIGRRGSGKQGPIPQRLNSMGWKTELKDLDLEFKVRAGKPSEKKLGKEITISKDGVPPRKFTDWKYALQWAKSPAAPRSSGAIIASASSHGVKAAEASFAAIAEILGGGKRMGMAPISVDAETYAKIKPHLQTALKEFSAAGKDLKELIVHLRRQFGDAIKPHVLQFLKDQKNEPTTGDQGAGASTTDTAGATGSAPAGIGVGADATGQPGVPTADKGADGDVPKPKSDAGGGVPGNGVSTPTVGVEGQQPVGGAGEGAPGSAGHGVVPTASGNDSNGPGGTGAPVVQSGDAPGNFDLRASSPVRLSKSQRKTLNAQAKAILALPPHPYSDTEKNILRQYTGEGGLSSGTEEALNQHYTDYDTIRAMYAALRKAGVKLANLLEPSVGAGNFVGHAPDAQWTTVDIDPTNHAVVRALYPQAKHYLKSFEDLLTRGFDAVLSNVPFLEQRRHATKKDNRPDIKNLHDFFFVHALDRVRDDGVIGFITSTGTMDTLDSAIRAEIVSKADVIGAFRLPQGHFEQNAHTSVTTDIIFLQKRPAGVEARPENKARNDLFVKSEKDGNGIALNEWYRAHPDAMLGKVELGKDKLYGKPKYVVSGPARLDEIAITYQPYGKPGKQTSRGEKVAKTNAPTDSAEFAKWAQEGGIFTRFSDNPKYGDNIEVRGGVVYEAVQEVVFEDIKGKAKVYSPVSGAVADKVNALVAILEQSNLFQSGNDEASVTGAMMIQQYREKFGKHPSKDRELKAFFKNLDEETYFLELSATFNEDFDPSDAFREQVRHKNTGRITATKDSDLRTQAVAAEDNKGMISFPTEQGWVTENDIPDLLEAGYALSEFTQFDTEGYDETEAIGNVPAAHYVSGWAGGSQTQGRIKSYYAENKKTGQRSPSFDTEYEVGAWLKENIKAPDLSKPVVSIQNDILYYSGNIYEKMAQLDAMRKVAPKEYLAALDKQEAKLHAVKPAPKVLEDISIKGSEEWLIPVLNRAGIPINSTINKETGVRQYSADWGELEPAEQDALVASMNNHTLAERDHGSEAPGKERPEESMGSFMARLHAVEDALRSAIQKIKNKLSENDSTREEVEYAFNSRLRNYVKPDYAAASYLLQDVIDEIEKNNPMYRDSQTGKMVPLRLRRNQIAWAVQALYEGKGINAHDVGGGKTMSAILLARALKRRGRAQKPMFVVPAKTIKKWVRETKNLFPDAVVVDLGNLRKIFRQKALFNLANSNADFVFISHEGFNQIQLAAEDELRYVTEVVNTGVDDPDARGRNRAELRQKAEDLKKAILEDGRDTRLTWDKLGIDCLFADEAHEFKNIGVNGQLVKYGIGTGFEFNGKGTGLKSARSYDFRFKANYTAERNNNGNVFLLTATPTPNKPMEIYTMLRHLGAHILDEYGIKNDREFAAQFFDLATVNDQGKGSEKKILRAITNAQELRGIMNRYIDKLSMTQMPWVKIPKSVENRVIFNQSEGYARIADDLVQRGKDLVKNPVKGQDTPISIYTNSRSGSIDPRLYGGPHAHVAIDTRSYNKDDDKIEWTVTNVAAVAAKNKNAGQLIFLDEIGREQVARGGLLEDVHAEIKAELVKRGMDPKEIAIINGGRITNPATGRETAPGTDAAQRKSDLESLYNEGKIRVLIGNTKSMGEGMDLAVKTTDIYHVDIPYTPGAFKQRNGRGVRFGNENSSVNIYYMLMNGSFDNISIDLVLKKKGWNDALWDKEVANRISTEEEMVFGMIPNPKQILMALERDPIKRKQMEIAFTLENMEAQLNAWKDENYSLNSRANGKERRVGVLEQAAKDRAERQADRPRKHAETMETISRTMEPEYKGKSPEERAELLAKFREGIAHRKAAEVEQFNKSTEHLAKLVEVTARQIGEEQDAIAQLRTRANEMMGQMRALNTEIKAFRARWYNDKGESLVTAADITEMKDETPGAKQDFTMGIGAAAAAGPEFAPKGKVRDDAENITGLREKVAALERKWLGMPEEVKDAARRFPEVARMAWDRITSNADYIQDLIDELAASPRPLKDVEVATLLIAKVQRWRERNEAASETVRLANTGTAEERAEASARYDRAAMRLEEIFDVASRGEGKSITETARGLSAMRMMMDDKFNLIEMEQAVRSNQKAPLSKEQRDELKRIKDEFNRTKKHLEDRIAALEEIQRENAEAIKKARANADFAKLVKEVFHEPAKPKKFSQRLVDLGQSEMDAALAGFRSLRGRASAVGADPQVLVFAARYGFGLISKGIGEFGLWSSRLKTAFDGVDLEPHLQDLYIQALKDVKAELAKDASAEAVKGAKPDGKPGKPGKKAPAGDVEDAGKLKKAIKALFRAQAEAGIDNFEEALANVHDSIIEVRAELTPEQVRDIYTDFGKPKKLSRDEYDVITADWRRQGQLLANIERVQNLVLPPLKSGAQRDKPSQTVRELNKQLSAMVKAAGLKVTDTATQLAGTLNAIKTRLENEIADLEKAITTHKEMTNNKSSVEYDEQARSLKAQRDALREEYEKIFPKQPITDEQRLALAIKAAERSLAQWEQRAKDARSGKFEPFRKTARPLPLSTRLDSIRAAREAAKEEVARLKELANPKKSDLQRAIDAKRKRMQTAADMLRKQMHYGDVSGKTVSDPVDISGDPEALRAQAELEQTKKDFALMKEAARRAGRSTARIMGEFALDVYEHQRDILSTGDVSAVGRQGGLLILTNPIIWARATASQYKAFSRFQSMKMAQERKERVNWRNGVYKKSGLRIADDDGQGNYDQVDNRYRLSIVKRIPPLAASNRAYATFLNTARMDLFDHLLARTGDTTDLSKERLQAIANVVNAETGYGKLAHPEAMSDFLYAPSFLMASLEVISGKHLIAGTPESRGIALKQYARGFTSLAAIYAFAYAVHALFGSGDDDDDKDLRDWIEWDPTSTDFGSIPITANYNINPLGFVRKTLTFATRFLLGSQKTKNGTILLRDSGIALSEPMKDSKGEPIREVPFGRGQWDLIFKFLQTKAHPAIGSTMQFVTGEDIFGNKQGTLQTIMSYSTPLSPRQAWDIFCVEDPDAALVLATVSMHGFDVSPDYASPKIIEQQNTSVLGNVIPSVRDEEKAAIQKRAGSIVYGATGAGAPESRQLAAKRLLESMSPAELKAALDETTKRRGGKTRVVDSSGKLTAYGKRLARLRELEEDAE